MKLSLVCMINHKYHYILYKYNLKHESNSYLLFNYLLLMFSLTFFEGKYSLFKPNTCEVEFSSLEEEYVYVPEPVHISMTSSIPENEIE